MVKVQSKGADLSRSFTRVTYPDYLDLIISGGGGYPLDSNLYQASRALFRVKDIIRKDGTIVLVSECSGGMGYEGFDRDYFEYESYEDYKKAFSKKKEYNLGQWGLEWVYELAHVSDLYIYSSFNFSGKIPGGIIRQAEDIEDMISKAIEKNSGARIAVLESGTFNIYEVA